MTHPPTWYQIGYHCLQSQSEVIAGRVHQVLLEAEVAFGGLHRSVAERKLDLLKRGVAFVRELGEGPAEVVRRDADA